MKTKMITGAALIIGVCLGLYLGSYLSQYHQNYLKEKEERLTLKQQTIQPKKEPSRAMQYYQYLNNLDKTERK